MRVDWSPSLEELLAVFVAAGISFGGVILWLRTSLVWEPLQPARPLPGGVVLQVIGWERDRIMSASKGIGATSGAFVLALGTALLKDEVKAQAGVLTIIGLSLGILGSLFLAGYLATRSREVVEIEVDARI